MIKNYIWIALLLISCTENEDFKFTGIWQSLNDPSSALEISENGTYQPFFRGKDPFGDPLKQKILFTKQNENVYSFTITDIDNPDISIEGKTEIVSPDRVRFYFFKHNNILDIADEYHRAEDFNSFDSIIKVLYHSRHE